MMKAIPIVVLTALIGLGGAGARAEPAPTVVELFTSQGCSSCPPADALLADLAKRPDVVALGFHVDYWDRLGWRDPFATRWATQRQEAYRDAFGLSYVYTPQIVVDGSSEAVGSRAGEVERLVAASRRSGAGRVAVKILRREDSLDVVVPAAPGLGSAMVVLYTFDQATETEVVAGENAGRRLRDVNAVLRRLELGRWDGGELAYSLPRPDALKGYAVLLEAEAPGKGSRPLLGAGRTP
jgi:hypothetical protein